MSNSHTIFHTVAFRRYLNEMNILAGRLFILPTIPSNSDLEFFREFDATISSTTEQKIPLYFQENSRSYTDETVFSQYAKSQTQMLELAKSFKQKDYDYRVEQPDTYLPFVNLPAVQNLEYLTPDNYARQVRDLLHAIFRRILPGSKFRSRGNGVLLKLDGNMIKRAQTFSNFMKQDDFWTNFLNENYPSTLESVQSYTSSCSELLTASFEYIKVRSSNPGKETQDETIHVYVPLPKPDHVPSASVKTEHGTVQFASHAAIRDLNRLIMLLVKISTTASVLANAYPLFNRHMRTHCDQLNKTQSIQHEIANKSFAHEVKARMRSLSLDEVQQLPESLRKALDLNDESQEQLIFLPFTLRGFLDMFPHHIFTKDIEDPMNKDWTPIPPSAFMENKEEIIFDGMKYVYKGVATQTGYSTTSPRSGSGTSPLIFGELVYTSLHEAMYNQLLAQSVDNLNLSEEESLAVKLSAAAMMIPAHQEVLRNIVEEGLFKNQDSRPSAASFFESIMPQEDTEPNTEEPTVVEDSHEDSSEQEDTTNEPEIRYDRLLIEKEPGIDGFVFRFTQDYWLAHSPESVQTFTINLTLEDMPLAQAFGFFRTRLNELSQRGTNTADRRIVRDMIEMNTEPQLRYITTHDQQIGETAVV